MRFMLIAKGDKNYEAGLPPSPELMAAIAKFGEDAAAAGKLVDTGGLMPSAASARVRLSGGKITVTDGPFAETKELIAGYAIVDVASKEDAIAMSRLFVQIHLDVLGPEYEVESEVRQFFDFSDMGATASNG